MTSSFEIILHNEPFLLLPQKAIFRPEKKQLIIADLHLGKATHFRKQGLAVPAHSHLKDIDKLHFLVDNWKPSEVLILGDLFHSDYNKEWLLFKSFLLHYPATHFILIEGNHDILEEEHYDLPNLFMAERLEEEHFVFSHHPEDHPEKYNVCGHIHPGIRLEGIARQAEKLPCFHLTEQHLVLPAFGYLTGLYLLEINNRSTYYLIAGNRIIPYRKAV
jgi:DNA ligase-associated metallophosphoesterase